MTDPTKALVARDIQLCRIESIKAEKIVAADAITAARQASKEADAKREAAFQTAADHKAVFLEAVLSQKRPAVRANAGQRDRGGILNQYKFIIFLLSVKFDGG